MAETTNNQGIDSVDPGDLQAIEDLSLEVRSEEDAAMLRQMREEVLGEYAVAAQKATTRKALEQINRDEQARIEDNWRIGSH